METKTESDISSLGTEGLLPFFLLLFLLEGSDPFKLALTFEVKKSVEKRREKCTVRTG